MYIRTVSDDCKHQTTYECVRYSRHPLPEERGYKGFVVRMEQSDGDVISVEISEKDEPPVTVFVMNNEGRTIGRIT